MAVYRRNYRPYEGATTPQKSRFMVIPRYVLATVFDSRPVLSFFIVCFIPSLVSAFIIYLSNSPTAQALVGLKTGGRLFDIDGFYFWKYFGVQGIFCFLITAWIGPGLISMDLSNDALPLYLSRPFGRADYLLGKFVILGVLLSAISWVPGLLLFGLQSSLAGWTWFSQYYWIAGSILLSALIWIVLLSLLALAISAWVKWRVAATALMLGVFFVLPGFGVAFDEVMRTHWGKLISLAYLVNRVWSNLFRVPEPSTTGVIRSTLEVPIWAAWAMLIATAALSLLMLNQRLKAKEVVR